MAYLIGEKVRLRALEPEDLEVLYQWENNPELWSVGNTLSPYSRFILKEYIAESHRDLFDLRQLRLMIEMCSSGVAIGMVDLFDFDPHHHRAGVGVLMDPLYQGAGLATEALNLLVDYSFSFLRLHQLYVHVPIQNEPSKALFAKCQFTISGVLSDWICTPESYSDVLVMQRLSTLR